MPVYQTSSGAALSHLRSEANCDDVVECDARARWSEERRSRRKAFGAGRHGRTKSAYVGG